MRGWQRGVLGVADELHVYGRFEFLVSNLFVNVAQLEPLSHDKPQGEKRAISTVT